MPISRFIKFSFVAVSIALTIAILPAVAYGWANMALDTRLSRSGPGPADNIQAQSGDIQVVPAASFIQASDTNPATDDANNWLFDIDGGFLTSDSTTDEVCLVAPVYLAPDQTIDSFTVFAADESSNADLTVYLDRTSLLGDWTEVARVSSTGVTSGIQTLIDSTVSTTGGANIISTEYHYHVSFCLSPNSGNSIRVYGAQVRYSLADETIQHLYLPIVLKSQQPPPTALLITNLTGGSLTYTVYNTPQGNITCTIPNGAVNQLCGTFTAGTYSYRAVAHCGEKVGQRTYTPGNDALTPFRCI